jgi:hypothetical protein
MKLRDYLRKHEMSVACFADWAGCSRPSVYNWLDGVMPQSSSMRRIMKATDGEVTRDDFEGTGHE